MSKIIHEDIIDASTISKLKKLIRKFKKADKAVKAYLDSFEKI